MDTDHVLGILAGVGLAVCGICVVVNAWRSTPRMKVSRSDPDLSILENAIPSASARRVQPSEYTSLSIGDPRPVHG